MIPAFAVETNARMAAKESQRAAVAQPMNPRAASVSGVRAAGPGPHPAWSRRRTQYGQGVNSAHTSQRQQHGERNCSGGIFYLFGHGSHLEKSTVGNENESRGHQHRTEAIGQDGSMDHPA